MKADHLHRLTPEKGFPLTPLPMEVIAVHTLGRKGGWVTSMMGDLGSKKVLFFVEFPRYYIEPVSL